MAECGKTQPHIPEPRMNFESVSRTSRREMLSSVGHAGLALGLSMLGAQSLLAQTDASAPRKLGFAIVGIGRLSINQLFPAFAHCKYARLSALVSGNPDKARQYAGKYGVDEKHIYSYSNFDNIANDDAIDVVYIVLPNSMHAEYTMRAAKAGKHVFCEKPMANSIDECKQMIDVCNTAKKKLAIAYRMQYEPYTQAAVDLCRRQVFGKARLITADHGFNVQPGTWRTDLKLAGGGPLVDVGIYCINAARNLLGAEPVEVAAQIEQPRDDPRFKEVEASMAFSLKFPSGVLASCTTTYAGSGGSRLRLMSEFGEVFLEPAFSYSAPKMWIYDRGQPQQAVRAAVNQFATEMDEFARCILDNKQPRTPGEEGLADVRVIRALYTAAAEGKTIKLA
jgi:predicted dehydrogenase